MNDYEKLIEFYGQHAKDALKILKERQDTEVIIQ